MNNSVRMAAANRIKKGTTNNIKFIKQRLKVQEQPDFNRWNTPSGASMRTYNQLDIDIQQEKLDKANAFIKANRQWKLVKVYPIEGRTDFAKYTIQKDGNLAKDFEGKQMFFDNVEQAELVCNSKNKANNLK